MKFSCTCWTFVAVVVGLATLCVESAPCTSSFDCGLNGECVSGSCSCDPAWTGNACDVMRFEPMELDTGYHNESAASWGGNVVYEDGEWHLFVAQMAQGCPLDDYGSNSMVVRATSAHPNGPFAFQEVVWGAFAHNPTVARLPNGSFALYIIGGNPSQPKDCTNVSSPTLRAGSATPAPTPGLMSGGIHVLYGETVRGPWTLHPVEFANASTNPWFDSHFTNPAPHVEKDGTVTLAFQGGPKSGGELVGVARAASWRGPYTVVTPTPVVPDHWYCVAGSAEDPFLWRSKRGWHIIVHGMCPSGFLEAHYAWSLDGVTWRHSTEQTWKYTVAMADGSTRFHDRVERPQLVFQRRNETDWTFSEPIYLINGVCDGIVCLEHPGMTYTIFRPLATSNG